MPLSNPEMSQFHKSSTLGCRNVYRVLMEKPEGKHHSDEMGIDVRVYYNVFLDGGDVTICQ